MAYYAINCQKCHSDFKAFVPIPFGICFGIQPPPTINKDYITPLNLALPFRRGFYFSFFDFIVRTTL